MTRDLDVFPGSLTIPYNPEHISSSQRSWLHCRRYWALSSVMRLRPNDPHASLHMEFGNVLHEVLGTWYTTPLADRSKSLLTGLLDTSVAARDWPEWMRVEEIEKLTPAIETFWKRLGQDKIVAPRREVEIRATLPNSTRTYRGYLDWYYYDGDTATMVIEDLKTSMTTIDATRYTLFNPTADDYLWATALAFAPVTDIVFSYLFVTPKAAWRVRVPHHSVTQQGKELAQIAREQETLPIVPHYDWHCTRCQYTSLCANALTGRDPRDIIKSDFVADGVET